MNAPVRARGIEAVQQVRPGRSVGELGRSMDVLRTQASMVLLRGGGVGKRVTKLGRAVSRNSWWESLKRVERPEGC